MTLSTLYRVGTLGALNAKEVETHLSEIFRSRKNKYDILIGDMNLDTVNWLTNSTFNNVHSSFTNPFNELGLSQLIHEPTHKCGKTLDILLSDFPHKIDSLNVKSLGTYVNSDHSPIIFSFRTYVKRAKIASRSIYNFKRANWEQLNSDHSRVDWLFLLDSKEIEIGWNVFKDKFLHL